MNFSDIHGLISQYITILSTKRKKKKKRYAIVFFFEVFKSIIMKILYYAYLFLNYTI